MPIILSNLAAIVNTPQLPARAVYIRAASSPDILVPRRIIYSVRQKSIQLIALLKTGSVKTLSELYAMSLSRSEVVATFIAVLELCAAGNLTVTESDGQMQVSLCDDGDIDLLFEAAQELVYND